MTGRNRGDSYGHATEKKTRSKLHKSFILSYLLFMTRRKRRRRLEQAFLWLATCAAECGTNPRQLGADQLI
jgi:hypothetical protein